MAAALVVYPVPSKGAEAISNIQTVLPPARCRSSRPAMATRTRHLASRLKVSRTVDGATPTRRAISLSPTRAVLKRSTSRTWRIVVLFMMPISPPGSLAGIPIRSFPCFPAKVSGIEAVHADVNDDGSVARAVAGAWAVVNTVVPSRLEEGAQALPDRPRRRLIARNP
jgi:hypothetical protein